METICPNCSHKFVVSLPRRTTKQNNRYWGLLIPALCDHLGYLPDEMHEELKLIFNGKDSKISPGEKYGGTTTTLTTKGFVDYCESVEFWALINFGIEIPEQHEEKKETKKPETNP